MQQAHTHSHTGHRHHKRVSLQVCQVQGMPLLHLHMPLSYMLGGCNRKRLIGAVTPCALARGTHARRHAGTHAHTLTHAHTHIHTCKHALTLSCRLRRLNCCRRSTLLLEPTRTICCVTPASSSPSRNESSAWLVKHTTSTGPMSGRGGGGGAAPAGPAAAAGAPAQSRKYVEGKSKRRATSNVDK